jgi:hypothetical protein
MESLGHHEQVLAVSRIVDQIADEFVAEKHRLLAEAGWTVISTATLGGGDLGAGLEAAPEPDVSGE